MLMELTVKQILKQSGITLQDVANSCDSTVPEVSRALNEAFIHRVRRTALDLIARRSQALQAASKSMDSTRAMDGSLQNQSAA